MPVFAAEPLVQFTSRIFEAAGAPAKTADLVARSLVSANLAGHDSHGVIRVVQYLRQIEADELRPQAQPEIERERPALAVLNGNRAFGQLAARTAIQLGVDKAQAQGMASVALKESGHVGRLGEWVGLAAEQGLIALAFVNGGRAGGLVAPFGGAERRLGTNPIAAAVPLGDRPPLVLDFATSAVAEGKIRVAFNSGKPVPEGWIVDKQGRPTTNPADLYDDGMLLPAAGHKGYGLALLADFLGGLLTGTGAPALPGAVLGNGALFLFLEIDAFRPRNEFLADAAELVQKIKSTRPAPGFPEVLLPGEPEQRTAEQRSQTGIPLDEGTWSQIVAAAEKLGVTEKP